MRRFYDTVWIVTQGKQVCSVHADQDSARTHVLALALEGQVDVDAWYVHPAAPLRATPDAREG